MTIEETIIAAITRLYATNVEHAFPPDLRADIEDGIVYITTRDGRPVAMMNPGTYDRIVAGGKP